MTFANPQALLLLPVLVVIARRPHREYGNQQPENFASNQQQTNQSTDATMPVAMSLEAAGQPMEQLMQEAQAAETWVQQKRRVQMQELNPDAPSASLCLSGSASCPDFPSGKKMPHLRYDPIVYPNFSY